MDKIILTEADSKALIEWSNNNGNLVKEFPCPFKSIEIGIKCTTVRIKAIRENDLLKMYIYEENKTLVKATMKIDKTARIVNLIKAEASIPSDHFSIFVDLYCALMAYIVYEKQEILERTEFCTIHRANKNAPKRKNEGVTYILNFRKSAVEHEQKGHHASPKGIFTVRGHFRHYKSGKEIWIEQFQKGTGEKRQKTYKLKGVA